MVKMEKVTDTWTEVDIIMALMVVKVISISMEAYTIMDRMVIGQAMMQAMMTRKKMTMRKTTMGIRLRILRMG